MMHLMPLPRLASPPKIAAAQQRAAIEIRMGTRVSHGTSQADSNQETRMKTMWLRVGPTVAERTMMTQSLPGVTKLVILMMNHHHDEVSHRGMLVPTTTSSRVDAVSQ